MSFYDQDQTTHASYRVRFSKSFRASGLYKASSLPFHLIALVLFHTAQMMGGRMLCIAAYEAVLKHLVNELWKALGVVHRLWLRNRMEVQNFVLIIEI